jgi:hypothetical protein
MSKFKQESSQASQGRAQEAVSGPCLKLLQVLLRQRHNSLLLRMGFRHWLSQAEISTPGYKETRFREQFSLLAARAEQAVHSRL